MMNIDTFHKPKQRSGLAGMILCFALICGMFTGCENPLEPPENAVPDGYGKVSITFTSGNARTVLPAKVFANYGYTFTKADGSPSITRTSSGETFTQNLEYGEWTVAVKAYAGAVNEANLAAEGAESFTVNAGAATIPVTLTGFPAGGQGIFKYKIQYPAGSTVREFSMKKLPDLTLPGVSLNSTFANSGGITTMSQTGISVDAGFYLVTIQLKNGSKYAGGNEVVHIYRNLTSEYAPAAFSERDFTANPSDAVLLALNGPELRVTQGAGGQLAVSWDPVAHAQGYKLYFSTVNDPAGAVQSGGIITGTSYLISGLANGTRYYVWASSVGQNGNTGPKGPAASGTPSAPTGRPASNPTVRYTANQGNIRLTWDAVPAAESYKVYVTDSAGGFSSDPTIEVVALTWNCTDISSIPLQSATDYKVKVIAANFYGDCTAPSTENIVSTCDNELLSPNTRSEKNVESGDRFRFKATAEAGKTYTVFSEKEGEGINASVFPSSFSNTTNADAEQVITLQINGTRVDRAYSGRVKIMYYDSDGVPQRAPVIAPITQLPGKLELSWNTISGATGYNVYRGVTPTSMTQLNSDPVVSPYSDTTVTQGTRYYYQVSAVNGSGEGPRSAAVAGTAFMDSQAVLLTPQAWADGEITTQQPVEWYKIEGVTTGTSYSIWGNSRYYGDGTKTIRTFTVAFYNAAGDTLRTATTSLWDTPITYTATSNVSGALYIRATPSNPTFLGTYGVGYSTATDRPESRTTLPSPSFIQALTDGVWRDGEISYPDEVKWYSITAVAGQTYRLWVNAGPLIGGNGEKTLNSNFFFVFYNSQGECTLRSDPSIRWSTPLTFTPSETGTLYFKAIPASQSETGTYGIVYSASTDRPEMPYALPSIPSDIWLQEDTWTDGGLPAGGGAQWFEFQVQDAGDYYVHFKPLNTSLSGTLLEAYDHRGTMLASSANIYSSPRYKVVTLTAGAKCFVKVSITSYMADGVSPRLYQITFSASSVTPAP